MATWSEFPARKCYRIVYRLTLDDQRKVARYKYSKTKPEARVLATQLEQL